MSALPIVGAVLRSEIADEFHLGRIVLLLESAIKRGSGEVEGITKLAKLDFLLRYPNCLKRALLAINRSTDAESILVSESNTIEAKMIRFRYGPWDARYRRWLALLSAQGLVHLHVKGRTVYIGLSKKGVDVASRLGAMDEFAQLKGRSDLTMRAIGSYSATKLMRFIYDVFPEIETLKWGDEIRI